MPLPDALCLALWERGAARHAIDRALLLADAGTADLAGIEPAPPWSDRPLGERDRHLMRLRCDWFGPQFEGLVGCPECAQPMSFTLDLSELQARLPPRSAVGVAEVDGTRLRLPTSRDLAAIVDAPDVEAAVAMLIGRLLEGAPASNEPRPDVERIESAIEAADPATHVTLDLDCSDCGARWQAPLDIAACLWDELQAQARRVVQDVHGLASAYGWSESDILAMGAARRQLYLRQVNP